MQERRKVPRLPALKAGRIVFNKRSSVIDCTVRNLSPRGALLRVGGPLGIPEKFDLELGSSGTHPCRVIWRNARLLGVSFG
jgi:hypothetical protein